MKKLIAVIVIAGGIWFWQKGGFAQNTGFDKSGKPIVVMFTASNCEPCQEAIKFFGDRGVPFEEKVIDPADEQDKDVKLWRNAGNNLLPLTLSGNGKVAGSSKWELISLLGNNFGAQYLLRDEQTYFKQHFDGNGSPRIVLYGTDWCPSCAALRKEFREHNVSFVDIDVEKSGEFEKLTRVMEIPGYPAVWVGYTRVRGTTYDAVKAVSEKKT